MDNDVENLKQQWKKLNHEDNLNLIDIHARTLINSLDKSQQT